MESFADKMNNITEGAFALNYLQYLLMDQFPKQALLTISFVKAPHTNLSLKFFEYIDSNIV